MTEQDELRKVRLENLQTLIEDGVAPHPDRFERTHTLAEAAELPEGTAGVRVAGRLKFKRDWELFLVKPRKRSKKKDVLKLNALTRSNRLQNMM